MYHNPVEVIKTDNWLEKCRNFQKKLNFHNPLIITSKGNLSRQKLSSKFNFESIFSDVKPDPTFESCQKAINFIDISKFDGVIAIGGGSVMDTAKVVMASMGIGANDLPELLKITAPFRNKVPSIFIPTTHGTGSEVTMWGTIWDMIEKKKYSISHPDLYPTVAILDGSLTLALPLDISIITIMDALSHSFEAIWNKNANAKSTEYAIQAITLILENIDNIKVFPKNLEKRTILLNAANIAGLAFSNTKTAAAHSISYPLTIYYNIPHGIASSITLVPLLEKCCKYIKKPLSKILNNLSFKDLDVLKKNIKKIPNGCIKYRLRDWNVKEKDLAKIVNRSYTKDRMENFIVDIDRGELINILKACY